MHALPAIRQSKTVDEIGPWHDGQRMPKWAFPLSSSRGYVLGSGHRWSVTTASGAESRFRILVAFDPAKAQYRALLAVVRGKDAAVLARLEYHPDHNGWHCHTKQGSVADVPWGIVRLAGGGERLDRCRTTDGFDVSETNALGFAFRVFNVTVTPEPGGLFA